MAQGVDFPGSNKVLGPPSGQEDKVYALPVYTPAPVVVSKWALSDEEISQIIETRCVYLCVQGATMPPVFIGSQNEIMIHLQLQASLPLLDQ